MNSNTHDIKYKVIYADPPWEYNGHVAQTKTGDSRAKVHYPTMSDDEILNFPINTYADDDCVLFLWTTVPNLPLGLQVLTKWGFKYKTCLTWKKEYHKRGGFGMGSYFGIYTEHLLMGTKGKVKQFYSGKSNIITAEWRGHSEKPQQFRTLIERATKYLEPKIELFARIKPVGWDTYGNDVALQNKPLEAFIP